MKPPDEFNLPAVYKDLCKLMYDNKKQNIPVIYQDILLHTSHTDLVQFHNDTSISVFYKYYKYVEAITRIKALVNNDKTATQTYQQEQDSVFFDGYTDDNALIPQSNKGKIVQNHPQAKEFTQELQKLVSEKQELLSAIKEVENKYLVENKNRVEAVEKLVELSTNLESIKRVLDEECKSKEKLIQVILKDGKAIDLPKDLYHYQFTDILGDLLCRNVNGFPEFFYGWGAPGCGKTLMGLQLTKAIAKSLGKDYEKGEFPYYHLACTPQTTEGRIIGFKNQMSGEYVKGVAYDAYKNGGLLALDEADKADASMLAGAGNSLENDHYMFGTELVKRHPDFYLIIWANTKGTGAKDGFASNKLDAATLDRFTMEEIKYDEELERRIVTHKDWAIYCQKVREYIKKHCAQSIYVTTRAIRKGDAYLRQGRSTQRVLDNVLFKLITPDIRKSIEASVGVYKYKDTEALKDINTGAPVNLFNQWLDKFDKAYGYAVTNNPKFNKNGNERIKWIKDYLKNCNITACFEYANMVYCYLNEWIEQCKKSNGIPDTFKGVKITNEYK